MKHLHQLLLFFFTFSFIALSGQTDRHREEAMKLLEKGEAAAAKEKMDEALKVSPEVAENHYVMGRVLMMLRNSFDAVVEFDIADSLKLETPELYLYKGIACYLTGKTEMALKCYEKSQKLNDRDYKLYYNRAQLHTDLGELDDAMTDLNAAIEIKPDYAEAYLQRAIVSFEDEKFKNAIRDCDKAIELKPTLADAYYYRAMSKGGNGNDKSAIDDFSAAIDINPNHDNALSHRGSAKYLSGNLKGACLDWDKAMQLGNDDAEMNYLNYCQ